MATGRRPTNGGFRGSSGAHACARLADNAVHGGRTPPLQGDPIYMKTIPPPPGYQVEELPVERRLNPRGRRKAAVATGKAPDPRAGAGRRKTDRARQPAES